MIIIKLESTQVKDFVSLLSTYESIEFDLMQGNSFRDGKSILGVLSLRFSNPISISVVSNSSCDEDMIRKSLISHGFNVISQ